MIAVDTNILVRYLTNDDPEQSKLAVALLRDAERIWVPKTVLLETEWILRAVYDLSADAVLKGLLQILGLPNVQIEKDGEIATALECYRQGMDFADAMHLASSREADCFYTFDRNFVRTGKQLGLSVVRLSQEFFDGELKAFPVGH